MIKTVIINYDEIDNSGYSYNTFDPIMFHAVQLRNNKAYARGLQTHCKEQIGDQCLSEGLNNFIVLSIHNIADSKIKLLLKKINGKEKRWKVIRLTKIFRIKNRKNAILINHSIRFCKNSVAHSLYVTWLRYFFLDLYKENTTNDITHMFDAKKIFDLIDKRGLGVFGTVKHECYDCGIVELSNLLKAKGEIKIKEKFPVYDMKKMTRRQHESLVSKWREDEFDCLRSQIPKNHAYKGIERNYA